MDETTRLVLTNIASAAGGAVLLKFSDWFTTRGDKKADREAAQAAARAEREATQTAANDTLATTLRKEQRDDNALLRERMAKLEGQVIELNKTNESLRRENLALTEQNGKQAYQLMVQAGQLAQQAERITAMQVSLDEQRNRNAALEAAMKAAHIPMPDVVRRSGDTGPLLA